MPTSHPMRALLQRALPIILLFSAGAAQAHPGHGGGFAQGLAHPFLGADHLLAMVAVGVWSSMVLSRGMRMAGPLVFLAMLAVGALAASAVGVGGTAIEIGVAASVVLLGALMIAGKRVSPAAGLCVIGVAAAFHGLAHGSELFHGGPAMATLAGMLLGSAVLHGVGYGVGSRMLGAPGWVQRMAGGLLGASGLVMLATRL